MILSAKKLAGEPEPNEAWEGVGVLLERVRPESSSHCPSVRFHGAYSENALYGRFVVRNDYVLSRYVHFMDPVYLDSCVECFVQPHGHGPYFNFEFNAGGTMLASYVTDPARVDGGGLKQCQALHPGQAEEVAIHTSLPGPVEPGMEWPTDWTLSFRIPFSVLEDFAGPLRPISGGRWRANFYKCGDETLHPHWISWAPVQALNFHRPQDFGILAFT